MELLTKCAEDDKTWGFVESHSVYRYGNTGNVKILVGYSPNKGGLALPYVLRAGEFIPLDIIDTDTGIDRYLKAKKPFYSLLGEGYVVQLKVALDFTTGEYLPDKSVCTLWYESPRSKRTVINPHLIKSTLTSVSSISGMLNDELQGIMKTIASFKGDREAFLRYRMNTKFTPDIVSETTSNLDETSEEEVDSEDIEYLDDADFAILEKENLS